MPHRQQQLWLLARRSPRPFMSAVYAVAPRPVTLAVPLSSSPTYVNPAQMQAAQAGPSSQSSPAKKNGSDAAPPLKRRRTDTPEDTAADSSGHQRKARDGPKKKKANRACFHCQKAHLTCDDCKYSSHKPESPPLSSFRLSSSALPALCQTWYWQQLHRRSP